MKRWRIPKTTDIHVMDGGALRRYRRAYRRKQAILRGIGVHFSGVKRYAEQPGKEPEYRTPYGEKLRRRRRRLALISRRSRTANHRRAAIVRRQRQKRRRRLA